MAPMPIAMTPDMDCRARACRRSWMRWTSCTFSPTTSGASFSTTAVTPMAPWCSSYSLQPVTPSSVTSFTKW